ncbi:phosphotransferase [Streptomyces tsukubensis]|uniref:Aminoglycoside phosphotransferase n=1 Tax=Streptomyces tsukubensis TaxID=83656 RepID=A0A1V4AFN4_9ACTN|nr:aminoglycoside phosphotransferase [Streptomyces tsukubensis]QFR97547.1 phosphotransferase [Streptomyces tsukubensis]
MLADRPDATVVRHGPVVAKAHAADTDPGELSVRAGVAAHPALAHVLLAPLTRSAVTADGRPVTFWPYGLPVDPRAPRDAPWEATATLLAALHAVPTDVLPGPLPPMRGPLKAARAVERMRGAGEHPDARAVEAAWAALPAWARAESPAPGRSLCHGDLHLGQLVRDPGGDGSWRLIDIDDMGEGDPAWDLARPAAWFACGLLAPDDWTRFLGAYRAAGGAAVPAEGDPWPALDVPARALTVQTAALAIAKSVAEHRELDADERDVIDACARIAHLPDELTPAPTK